MWFEGWWQRESETAAICSLRILHVTPTYYPATHWGGPILSLYGMCNALATHDGLDLRVLTSDAAGPKLSQRIDVPEYPANYAPGYEVYLCHRLAGASFAPGMFAAMPRLIRWADIVHVTAVYSPSTIPALLLCRVLGKPVVWSPRGAFQRWEGSTRLRLKAVWDAICRSLVVPALTVIHATSEEEAEATRLAMPHAGIEVIPNGVDLPGLSESRPWVPEGKLRLLYLGRLHPIKGVENLLRALASIDDKSISLKICGTGESSYVDSLRTLCQALGLQDRATFVGEIAAHEKIAAFQSADICVVPSFSENFGMVVAEALAHAVPVIAARGTPWAAVLEQRCGLWVDNTPADLAVAIAAMRRQDLRTMGLRGREWVRRWFGWREISIRMISLYQELVDARG